MIEFFRHLLQEFELPLSNPVLIFSLILFIILLSPILLKKINIPGIIGLIISGVIIGPHGLNILAKNSAVDLFSTIGLLYIMFIAGLELDMNEFKANRNKSLLFGFFTFILPLSIGFPVCFYLLQYDFNASFLTASMFATHTLVAYPIVSKLGIAKNQAVAITVGGTILTDTAVLIILAVIMGSAQGSLNQAFWIKLTISLAIFSAIMFLLIPRIAKWFFKKLESEKHAHYIFVLSVVFFAAFLAEVAGVEPIIGAFVAGLALNPLIPHSSALMNRIEFIGNSLFIPFFLISVGMLVDVSVILSGPTALIVAGTLSVVAIFGKWIAAFFTQIVFKYTRTERQLIFGLSSAHAAATLAVILVGYKAKILDENILNGTIILILITCIVASFATEKAAKKIAICEEEFSHEDAGRDQILDEHILIPLAKTSAAASLLDFALLIKDKKSSNPITLLTIVPNNNQAEKNILKYRKAADKFVIQGSASEVKINTIARIDHNPASGIARTSKEIMSDIVIVGWPRKTGFIDKIFGENVDSIINNVDKSLFICRFQKNFIEEKRLVFICPPFSERGVGFHLLLQKICRLSQELSIPIVLYAEYKTHETIQQIANNLKLNAKLGFKNVSDWEDFESISDEIKLTDLVVFNLSRKGSVSYQSIFDKLPQKFEKYFNDNNVILVYPQDDRKESSMDAYEDFTSSPLAKGIEAIEQIGRGIGSILKKG
ncbi:MULTISPECIES: cation:proton antiporter [Flavobacterium]|uniref:Glutathione-regulated potassium-efflux system protein KefC n=1 Tax=Flavobacterium anhuiense TaxID=459526 RepID=A0AAC9D1N6_9FLAO|nr:MULTISPECIES: cation:proton antiporter [Flavobacterium]AOC95974.1 Glutathione-regulated potassium-efflux system protein KefC [Flavobacterium anhuiense]EJF99856.1 sodium/hydrogen exchanger [Flavobacterium sp. F52]MXO05394.1 cation:proton antiporter [Flavobacterium sp. HBTb2-11-1]SCY63755.1 Kef-type K+ transport system, membrane component KefB [Flavobacterium anhuiense]